MPGQQTNASLTTVGILQAAAESHPEREIVSVLADDSVHRYRYQDALVRVCKLANSLTRLNLSSGQNIATLAPNHYRHLELVYAVSGIGSVIHPLNAHLFSDQLHYIISHAKDCCIFVDPIYLPQLERLEGRIESIKTIVLLCDRSQMPESSFKGILCYEDLIAGEPDHYDWPDITDEACGLCYTSGTTGNPKGVQLEHHAMLQHAQTIGGSDYFDFTPNSVVMPIVPMCYVYSWGVPFAAMICGATLVLPGCALLPENIQGLIETELVTHAFAGPDIWRKLHFFLTDTGLSIDSLDMVGVGGDPSPVSLVKLYAQEYGVYWMGLWGMAETSPLLTAATRTDFLKGLPDEARYALQASAGQPIAGIEVEIRDALGRVLPHDGKACGNIHVRGKWVLSSYYKDEASDSFTDGWFDTGDVGAIDEHGYLNVIDRSKDVIYSGGEWIISVELERAALAYDPVLEVCVVGALHEKWSERPIMLVTLRHELEFSEYRLRKILQDRVDPWWIPDAILVVDELPHTGTGKLKKIEVRNEYRHYLLQN